jgi:hypothetical protein
VLYKMVTSLQFPGGQVLNVNMVIPGVSTLEEAMDAFGPMLQAHARKAYEEEQTATTRQALLAGHTGRGPANGRFPR